MTTEDNEDQEALGVVRAALTDPSDDANDAYRKDIHAQRILSALSEVGYAVVKTEDARVAQAIAAARIADRKCDWRVPESDTLGGGEQ